MKTLTLILLFLPYMAMGETITLNLSCNYKYEFYCDGRSCGEGEDSGLYTIYAPKKLDNGSSIVTLNRPGNNRMEFPVMTDNKIEGESLYSNSKKVRYYFSVNRLNGQFDEIIGYWHSDSDISVQINKGSCEKVTGKKF